MTFLYDKITYLFDPLQHFWEHEKLHKKVALVLVLFFLCSLVSIELNRQGLLSSSLAPLVPRNHFFAVQACFTVVLVLEVISLIFIIPCSFSRSVGKQFEILALILIRNAFKELSGFAEPIRFTGNEEAVLSILSNGFGALVIFVLLGVYYAIQKSSEEKMLPFDIYSFIAAKKGIALILLVIFTYLGVVSLLTPNTPHSTSDFLHSFYTILILTDILLVLLAQCYQPSFYAIFRNSGFALSTLIIRIALAAPAYYNVLLGVLAVFFAILLTLVSTYFFQKKGNTNV
ncbi:MAG: hypothetical protein CSB23_04295 [Deltaproteobacteria bacterium]|nr:MAG: hypothetical protein CSB23_04295 [Deltaproteobacteria bacterium]